MHAPLPTARRPVVIAVDGRSGAGKTTLAVELAASLRAHRSVTLFHLEDLYPGWDGLACGIERYVRDVLTPLRRGERASWRAWDWTAGSDGEQRHTQPADVVLVEGVGSGAAAARGLVDALVWVEAGEEDRRRRAIARDGEAYLPHWDRWAAQEAALLADDDVPSAAVVTVAVAAGGPGAGRVADEVARRAQQTIAALAELPALRDLLGPERAAADAVPLTARRVPLAADPEAVFAQLYADSPRAVWLDASTAPASTEARSRFSIMADDAGSHGRRAVHRRGQTEVTVGEVTAKFAGPFFRWLDSAWGRALAESPAGLDAGFALGWLGYLGYELKRECGGSDVDAGIPDAQLIHAGRAVVLDHGLGEAWLLALEAPDAGEWLTRAERAVGGPDSAVPDQTPAGDPASEGGPVFASRDSAQSYMDKVRASQSEIAEGNTYEVCLTTTLEARIGSAHAPEPFSVYAALRRRSPAPFAAFARFDGLAIASTSPERFLSVGADGTLRAEPIKGTRRRRAGSSAADDAAVVRELAENPKDRAENLMIVDLLRNDLSHHAVPGSVGVSRLFAVETYATVHQLVSTIDARLRPGASRAEAIAAAFPPGSMTGAPKISTMAILDRLEGGPRGVYSGAIGYFSRTGAADLSVVIRTLVMEQLPAGADDAAVRLTLGVGGAVVADSVPEDEYEEIRTKAFAVLSTLGAEFPD